MWISSNQHCFFADAISSRFGIRLPATSTPQTDLATASTKISASSAGGLQYMAIQLGGTISIANVAKRLGFTWTLPEDLFTISNPTVEYDAVAPSFGLDMTVDIPAAAISAMKASLFVSNVRVNLQVSVLRVTRQGF
jgi:hypothetical protein